MCCHQLKDLMRFGILLTVVSSLERQRKLDGLGFSFDMLLELVVQTDKNLLTKQSILRIVRSKVKI